MTKYTIYHNPRCSKSRAALQILQEKGVPIEVREYLKNPLKKEDIMSIAKILKRHPLDFTRKKEDEFKNLNINGDITVEKMSDILEKHPRLLERPIIIRDKTVGVIARPPENAHLLLP